jgi:hypothetical protein
MTEPGPLGDEAARLLEALQTWVRGATGNLGAERIATDSPECRLCPVCLLLSVIRGAQPEVFEHLVEAAGSLALALRTAVEAHDHAPRRGRGVERIDIS